MCGLWHSHVNGDTRISGADLDAFTRIRRNALRPPLHFAAIILTPAPNTTSPERGWQSPQPHRWVVGDGWFEQARLTVTDAAKSRTAPKTYKKGPAGSQWVVATRSFSTEYDGTTVQIVAGRDRMSGQHPIAAPHPDAFRPDNSRPDPGIRTRTVAR
jgi:hypothetical protein